MIYNDFQDKKLSALGMGCMRFPTCGEDKTIDEAKTAEMFEYAINNGINYFDTAWGYHDGKSEPMVGKLLEKYPRESFYLASKFPGYAQANWGKHEEIFAKQLERCRVDYFDFYLIHNLTESNIDAYLDDNYGDVMYFVKMREEGKIKHLGFSTHGTLDTMRRFLDKYGKYMEFCQLQVNWLDYSFQNAKAKIEMMKEYGNIPVWVMEPVRGGKLATLEEASGSQRRRKHSRLGVQIHPEPSRGLRDPFGYVELRTAQGKYRDIRRSKARKQGRMGYPYVHRRQYGRKEDPFLYGMQLLHHPLRYGT